MNDVTNEQFYFFTYGKRVAPAQWQRLNYPGIHRFYYIIDGEGWYIHQTQKHRLLKGHLYLFSQNATLEVGHNTGNRVNHLYFDFSVTPPLKATDVIEIPLEKDFACQTLTLLLCKLMDEKPRDNETIEKTFAALFDRFCHTQQLDHVRDSRVDTILQHIHTYYYQDLPNALLADLVHLEENHFIRLFRKNIGTTPHQYILRYRLNMAVKYLASGCSVAEAAERTGFSDSTVLCHIMKREMKITPSKLKREYPYEATATSP